MIKSQRQRGELRVATHDGVPTEPAGAPLPPHWTVLLDSLLEAACLVDAGSLHIVAANPAAARLLGRRIDTLVGLPVVDLAATPEDQFFWEDAAGGRAATLHSDALLRRPDGSTLHVERRAQLLQSDGLAPVYLLAMLDQSGRQAAEDELEQRVAELRATLESTADGILVTDPDGAIRGFNRRFSTLWDLPESLLTRRDDQAIHRWLQSQVADRDGYQRRLQTINDAPTSDSTDLVRLRNGRVLERVTLPQNGRGRPIGRVYSFRDITQRLDDEAHLRLAAKVFESSLDAVFIIDTQWRVVAANPAFERMTGRSQQALVGMPLSELLIDAAEPRGHTNWSQRLFGAGRWEGELLQRGAGGVMRPVQASLTRVSDQVGHAVNFVAVVKDLSEREADRRRIEHLAYNDTLTGLPNRLALAQRAEFEIALAGRESSAFAMLYIDLDRFKQINESLGHLFGDRVLVEVAARVKACLRQVDTVARLGSDEFAALLHKADAHGAEATAKRVLEALAAPFELDGVNFTVTCSIGVAMFPSDGTDMDTLLTHADAAMSRVKERGRAGLRFYQPQMNVDLLARMKVDHAMRQALARGDFRLHYQPQVDIATGAIVGAEALVRWRDPELGEMAPGRFIPVAEETGFIIAIGDWVLKEAVQQCAAWRARGHAVPVSVNVSALQFQQADFYDRVAQALQAARLPAHLLELELTETILIGDVQDMTARLQRLHGLGVRLAIDDFGTGYSSLGYLKRFPIDRLKIDRSFIDKLPDDESDAVITRAVIHLARALNLKVIAEGVETEAQRRFLVEAGCDEFQGWLFAPAVAASDFEALMSRGLAAVA